MTMEEFLALTETEQGLEAGRCFNDKPWKHWCIMKGHKPWWVCTKCRAEFDSSEIIPDGKSIHIAYQKHTSDSSDCPVPDPFPLDWNAAKRVQAECKQSTFAFHLMNIGGSICPKNMNVFYWSTIEALPIHYFAAAMACMDFFKEN